MKTNIKMRVTPQQSRRVQEICFEKGIEWLVSCKLISHLPKPYLIIENSIITYRDYGRELEHNINIEEIDADLFIRTNGTCEETFKEQHSYNDSDLIIKDDNIHMIEKAINKHNEIKDGINEWAKQFNDIEQKQKKKNEILKKARIKRKNQREELHKLNLKLQKCISLEEHRKVINWHIERNQSLFAEIDNLKAENIEMGRLVNFNRSALDLAVMTKDLAVMTKDLAMKELEELNKQIEKINKDNVNYLSDNILLRDKEIEKLKAVIEYLENKVK